MLLPSHVLPYLPAPAYTPGLLKNTQPVLQCWGILSDEFCVGGGAKSSLLTWLLYLNQRYFPKLNLSTSGKYQGLRRNLSLCLPASKASSCPVSILRQWRLYWRMPGPSLDAGETLSAAQDLWTSGTTFYQQVSLSSFWFSGAKPQGNKKKNKKKTLAVGRGARLGLQGKCLPVRRGNRNSPQRPLKSLWPRLTVCGYNFLLQNTLLHFHALTKKAFRQMSTEASMKHLTTKPQNLTVIISQESLRNCHKQNQSKEHDHEVPGLELKH